jgi:adenylosuccinate lyase
LADPFDQYLSPFSWRYGSDAMRAIWSEANKRRLWRQIWVDVAAVQSEFGLVTAGQLADLQAHMHRVDIPRALEIESEIKHDLVAELNTFAEQAVIGGRILHLGMTSMDVVDNADVLRVATSLDKVITDLGELLLLFAARIDQWADQVVIGFTHIQPAEPTSLGYRFAFVAQDLLSDWEQIRQLRKSLRTKGLRGAVGSGASFADTIGLENLPTFEARLSERLGLPFFEIVNQTYPRRQDYAICSALAGAAATFNKFAIDLRLLQSPPIGEMAESFGHRQVGSSAMPFKRNPIRSEKINSLSRSLAQMPRQAWDNAANSLLERTLDDSANRRSLLPEAFLTMDELLKSAAQVMQGLTFDETAAARNLAIYGPFAGTERLLLALVAAGADRQEMHEHVRQHAMRAWQAIQAQKENPLMSDLSEDSRVREFLSADTIRSSLQAGSHIGDTPQRAQRLANKIRMSIQPEP